MAERIDAAVDAVQRSRGDPPLDLPHRQAGGDELGAGDQARSAAAMETWIAAGRDAANPR